MAVLSPGLIAELASGQGFTGNGLVLAIAVCLAESGGNTLAHNGGTIIDREDSYGLWQINILAHPEYGPGSNLYNPTSNVRAAWAISSGGSNWSAWGAYTNGSYRKYLGVAQQAAGISAPPVKTGGITPPPISRMTVDSVFSSKGLWKWYASGITNPYNGITEKGVDYGNTWGTPIGIIVGGQVKRIVHNNNSIGDVVEILGVDNRVYLYQHIRTKVRSGQIVSTGDVVGTEDGLPVDQFSTGPHIEVRVTAPGTWNPNIDSWVEPWINPTGWFSNAGSFLATGGGVSLNPIGPGSTGGFGLNIGFTSGVAKTYVTLSSMTHETLINTPGFYGIALTLDEAEQFPGWIDLTTPQTLNVGPANIPVPDVNGEIRSIGATISDNAIPFFVRSGLVSIGLLLVIALLIKAVEGPAKTLAPLLAA